MNEYLCYGVISRIRQTHRYLPIHTFSLFPCIGLVLCESLLLCDTGGPQHCLACKNMQWAQAARLAFLASHHAALVALLQIRSISSVIGAAQEVKFRLMSQ